MSSTIHEISPEVLEVLVLPELGELAEDRATGRACLWGGEPLSIETAVDLGEHRGDDDSTRFLRACRKCTAQRAHSTLFTHGSFCDLCRSEELAETCAVGRGLYRLLRDCSR